MASLEEILGKKINTVKELREEIKRLQDSLVGVDAESQQFKTTTRQLSAAQDELKKVQKAGTQEMQAAEDSIVGMERAYKKLYDQYKLLSDEQRNSSFGKNMAKDLEELSSKLNVTKKDVGNFKDNIGRYANDVSTVFQTMGISIGGLQGPLKLAAGGVKTLGTALKSLAMNPIGAVIMAIVVAFKALEAIVERVREAINNNEESQMRLREAMASFQPIIDKVSNAFDWLGQRVVDVIEFFANLFDTVRKVKASITDFIGITKGARKAVDEEIKTYKNLEKSKNDLIKTTRTYNEENAKDSARVAKLREEAAETDNLREKKKLLEEAREIEGKVNARNTELAEKRLEILKTEDSLTANSTEDNEKLSKAIIDVSNAQAKEASDAEKATKEIRNLGKSTKDATKGAEEYKKALKLVSDLLDDNRTEIEKLENKYKEEKKLLEKYGLDTTLLTKKYEKEKTEIIYKSLEKQKQMRLNDINYAKQAADRYRETLTGLDQVLFDKEETEKTIGNLQKLRNEANKLYEEWLNTQFLFYTAQKNSKEWFEEAKSVFSDLFKEGSNFENFEYPLSRIKEIFDEIGTITGDDIIDIESIDLNIKILENKVKGLKDNIVSTKVNFKMNAEAEKYLEQLIALGEEEDKIRKENQNGLFESLKGYEDIAKRRGELEYQSLANQKAILEQELNNFSGSQELKLQLLNEYYSITDKMRENDIALEELASERKFEAIDSVTSALDSVVSSLSTVRGGIESIIDADLESGRITEEQAKKKKKALLALEKVELAMNIMGIAGSTASGIMNVWQAYAAEKIANAETAAATGPAAAATLAALNAKSLISAIAQTAGLASTGAANIAAATMGVIAKQKSMNADSGGGSSVSVTPQAIDSTPYSYTRSVQTQEEEDALNRPIYVTVTDIEEGLGHRAKVVEESSF